MTFHAFHQQTSLSLWGTARGLLTFVVRSFTQIKTCSPTYRPAFIIYCLNLSRASLPAPLQAPAWHPWTDSADRHLMIGVASVGGVGPKDGAKDRECFVGTVTRLLWEFRLLEDFLQYSLWCQVFLASTITWSRICFFKDPCDIDIEIELSNISWKITAMSPTICTLS